MSHDSFEHEFADMLRSVDDDLNKGEIAIAEATRNQAAAMHNKNLEIRRRSSLFNSFKNFFSNDPDQNTLNVNLDNSIFGLIDRIHEEANGAPSSRKVYLRKENGRVYFRTTLTPVELPLTEQDFLDAGIKVDTFNAIVAIPADGNFLTNIAKYTYEISLIIARKGYLPSDCPRSSKLIMDETYGRIIRGLAFHTRIPHNQAQTRSVAMSTHRGTYLCYLLSSPRHYTNDVQQGYYLYRTDDAYQRILVHIVHPDRTDEGPICLTTLATNIPELSQLLSELYFPQGGVDLLTFHEGKNEKLKRLPWWISTCSTQNKTYVELNDIFHQEALSNRFTQYFSRKIQESNVVEQNGWGSFAMSLFGRGFAQIRYALNPPVRYTYDTIIKNPEILPQKIAEIANTFVYENIEDIDNEIRQAEYLRP